jgi:hypothetical protein
MYKEQQISTSRIISCEYYNRNYGEVIKLMRHHSYISLVHCTDQNLANIGATIQQISGEIHGFVTLARLEARRTSHKLCIGQAPGRDQ